MAIDEILDLVNENDEVIGEIERTKANSGKNLIHREIGIILLGKNNKVLVQKRSQSKKTFPGQWILSVGGHVSKGVSPEKAAHIELVEELGFDTKLILIDKKLMHYSSESNFANVFLGKIPEGTSYKLDPQETELVKTLNFDEYKNMIDNGEIFQQGSAYFLEKFWSGAYDSYLNKI